MPRALVITNPAAARTREGKVAGVRAAFRAGGWDAEVLATGGPGDARTLAEYGVREKMDVVAVFGGDGTTMQAAAALVGTDVALGVIPGGTGNLLAGNLRIPRVEQVVDCGFAVHPDRVRNQFEVDPAGSPAR